MRVALTGNPNSGKTTMYNALTGRREKIGNWAGVTVDRKESVIKKKFSNGDQEVIAVDLPGAYSMSPFTLGTYLADYLTGWIETFQEWVGGMMENANPLLYALLVDGIIGGVGAVVGFLPLVMVMYFPNPSWSITDQGNHWDEIQKILLYH